MTRSVRLAHVVGARPNFPKLAPVHRAAVKHGLEQVVIHTGQHYDDSLSENFIRALGVPEPDYNLGVGSASHAAQTARIMERIEPILFELKPDWVVVYGDVNSTMAAAIVAAKEGLPLAHVEAGLRSHDWSMPEEVNRVVTDRLANLLLTPSRDASEALRREGEPESEIVFVGNVMVDSLLHALSGAAATGFRDRVGAGEDAIIVTMHRPSNVDDPGRLERVAGALRVIAATRRVIFPAHPRTLDRLQRFGIDLGNVTLLEPVGYFEMLDLVRCATAVITDSGGLQEETTVLGIPCFTVRDSTERPITISEGTNQLTPDPTVLPGLVAALAGRATPKRPEGWDGSAGTRIVHSLIERWVHRV